MVELFSFKIRDLDTLKDLHKKKQEAHFKIFGKGIRSDSLVKLHIFQIKRSLTLMIKEGVMEENTHKCPIF